MFGGKSTFFDRSPVPTSKLQTQAVVTLELALLWAIASNYLSQDFQVYMIPTPFEYGVLTFFFLLGLCLIVLAARGARMSSTSPPETRRLTTAICVVGALSIGYFLYQQAGVFSVDYNLSARSDLTINTWTAERNTFDLKENPYSTACQLWHNPVNALHVTHVGKQLYMFGVPYDFGYAYFPAMFMSYEPFRHLEPSIRSIRIANAAFYIATLASMAWLAALFAPAGWKILGAVMTLASFACNQFLAWEYFYLGTVDVVIPLLVLLGCIAAYYKHPSLAGVLFGWMFACKLLPGGFICLIIGAWFWRKPERWKFWIPMVATFVGVMLPFILRNPPAFLSATVLYYLTEHAHGDRSSMYFYLPSGVQSLFMVFGYVLTLSLVAAAVLKKNLSLLDVIASSFIVFIVFMAFSKLSHDNYFFSVAPLGSVALVGYVLSRPAPSNKVEMALAELESSCLA